MRRQFDLPEDDVDYLNTQGYRWEALLEGGFRWLLIHDYVFPDGYTISQGSVALMIHPSYPDVQIDMAYFYPALQRRDSLPIGALSPQRIDGKVFQRWSRHRTATNPWRPGMDDLGTHLALVDDWLQREFVKRPVR